MFAPRVCFIDVETTGASPQRARVTEVGVVTVDRDGDDLRVSEWSSLVNPGEPIPSEIQWLTGITNEMVRTAPPFAALADALYDRLDGAVFVAHNARFDYGFVRAEFERAGRAFHARTLCTVRLSRLLYPERAPHSLDAIVQRFGLEGEARHRALGDARVLWRLLQTLYQRHPPAELEAAITRLLKRPSTPAHLPPEALDEVPRGAGVYLFYGLNAHPIYIGKSIDLRTRVAAHFSADHRNGRDLQLSQEVHRLEWEETAGELGALLREAELVKTRLPAHNVALRRKERQVLAAFDSDGRLATLPAHAVAAGALAGHYGPFGSRAAVRTLLLEVARETGLCAKVMGLEGRRRTLDGLPCFLRQLHRCAGACTGDETAAAHRARLDEALARWQIAPWPFDGPVALVERDRARLREDLHVFDAWCWLGTVRTVAAAQALSDDAPRHFDADVYRIVRQAVEPSSPWADERMALVPPQASRGSALAQGDANGALATSVGVDIDVRADAPRAAA